MDKVELVARFLANENGAPNYNEDDWAIWVSQAKKILIMLEIDDTQEDER